MNLIIIIIIKCLNIVLYRHDYDLITSHRHHHKYFIPQTIITDFTSKMAKRNAATELNHDNWEEEDEKEEAGEFKRASEEQMKVIRNGRLSHLLIDIFFPGKGDKEGKEKEFE